MEMRRVGKRRKPRLYDRDRQPLQRQTERSKRSKTIPCNSKRKNLVCAGPTLTPPPTTTTSTSTIASASTNTFVKEELKIQAKVTKPLEQFLDNVSVEAHELLDELEHDLDSDVDNDVKSKCVELLEQWHQHMVIRSGIPRKPEEFYTLAVLRGVLLLDEKKTKINEAKLSLGSISDYRLHKQRIASNLIKDFNSCFDEKTRRLIFPSHIIPSSDGDENVDNGEEEEDDDDESDDDDDECEARKFKNICHPWEPQYKKLLNKVSDEQKQLIYQLTNFDNEKNPPLSVAQSHASKIQPKSGVDETCEPSEIPFLVTKEELERGLVILDNTHAIPTEHIACRRLPLMGLQLRVKTSYIPMYQPGFLSDNEVKIYKEVFDHQRFREKSLRKVIEKSKIVVDNGSRRDLNKPAYSLKVKSSIQTTKGQGDVMFNKLDTTNINHSLHSCENSYQNANQRKNYGYALLQKVWDVYQEGYKNFEDFVDVLISASCKNLQKHHKPFAYKWKKKDGNDAKRYIYCMDDSAIKLRPSSEHYADKLKCLYSKRKEKYKQVALLKQEEGESARAYMPIVITPEDVKKGRILYGGSTNNLEKLCDCTSEQTVLQPVGSECNTFKCRLVQIKEFVPVDLKDECESSEDDDVKDELVTLYKPSLRKQLEIKGIILSSYKAARVEFWSHAETRIKINDEIERLQKRKLEELESLCLAASSEKTKKKKCSPKDNFGDLEDTPKFENLIQSEVGCFEEKDGKHVPGKIIMGNPKPYQRDVEAAERRQLAALHHPFYLDLALGRTTGSGPSSVRLEARGKRTSQSGKEGLNVASAVGSPNTIRWFAGNELQYSLVVGRGHPTDTNIKPGEKAHACLPASSQDIKEIYEDSKNV